MDYINMDYKNTDYKEKLEKAKELYPTANADQRYVLECLFPELAESEDERIRKEILNVFKQLGKDTTICGRNYDYAKWISWLEKQGEQKSNPYSGTSFEYNGHIWGMCARDCRECLDKAKHELMLRLAEINKEYKNNKKYENNRSKNPTPTT